MTPIDEEQGGSSQKPRLQEYEGELHIHVHNQEPEELREGNVDLMEIFFTLWDRRRRILKITAGFILAGVFVALLSPVEYQTEATLMPEAQSSQSSAGNLLQQYGGMLGISGGGAQMQEGTIPPQLYPQIVQSIPFQVELMDTPVRFASYDTTATLGEFFRDIYAPSVLGYVRQYTIGLPGKLSSAIRGDGDVALRQAPAGSTLDRDSIYTPTREEKRVMESLIERINISQQQESGIVNISVEMPDPRAAAETGRAALNLLKQHVKEYQTQKANADLEFVQQQVERVRADYEEAQQALADFRDSNLNPATSRAQTREQELQSEYQRMANLYNSLSQRLEQARIRVQENTPVFSVLQPISQPLYRSKPQRKLIVLVSLIMGVVVACGWVLLSSVGPTYMEEIRREQSAEQ